MEQFYLAPLEGSVPLKMRAVPQIPGVEGAGDNRGFSNNYLSERQELFRAQRFWLLLVFCLFVSYREPGLS